MLTPTPQQLAALLGLRIPETDSPGARFLTALYDEWDESLLSDAPRDAVACHHDIIARIRFTDDGRAWQAFVDLALYREDLDLDGRISLSDPSTFTGMIVYQSLHRIAEDLLDLLEDGAFMGEVIAP